MRAFPLTEPLAIKRVAALDVLKKGHLDGAGGGERFDADFVLMAGERAS